MMITSVVVRYVFENWRLVGNFCRRSGEIVVMIDRMEGELEETGSSKFRRES